MRALRWLAVFVLLAAACAPTTSAPAASGGGAKVGGTVTFAAITDPETLDLHQTSNPVASTIFGSIYEPLLYQDLDNSYKGLLAQSWTVSADSKTITFTLRSGITFTDGSPFNAAAVQFTYERLQRLGAKSPIFETLKGATFAAPSDGSFVLTLPTPYAPVFHDLATSYAGILSPVAVRAAGDKIDRVAVGTGPYRLKEWQTGQQVTLERNDAYAHPPAFYANRGAPFIQELRYRVIPDPATQLAALDAGEIDVLGLQAKDIAQYGADKRVATFDSYAYGLTYLGFDAARKPLDDPRLRRALAHAVNKAEIVQTVFGGTLAKVACCPIAESIQGYDPRLQQYELTYEVAAATAGLEALGYAAGPSGLRSKPDGSPFQPVLYTSTSSEHGKIATLLQAQFRAVGVDLQVKQLEPGALLAATPKAEHDLYLNGYSWNEPDMFSLFLSCDRVKSSNRVLFCDQTLEALIRAGRTELDQAKRMQIYFDAQKYTLEQAPWQPLYMPISKTAVAARIAGLRQGPAGGLLWHDAYVVK